MAALNGSWVLGLLERRMKSKCGRKDKEKIHGEWEILAELGNFCNFCIAKKVLLLTVLQFYPL